MRKKSDQALKVKYLDAAGIDIGSAIHYVLDVLQLTYIN